MLTKDNNTVYSQQLDKHDLKLLIMCVIALWTFGHMGVGANLLLRLLSYLAAGRDQASSHGISVIESSRLGGLAITLLLVSHALGMVLLTDYTPGVVRSNLDLALWVAVFFCACLGLCEDIKADFLSPALRLLCKFVVFGLLLLAWPRLVPRKV